MQHYAQQYDLKSLLEIFDTVRATSQAIYPQYQSQVMAFFGETMQPQAAIQLYYYHTKTLGMRPSSMLIADTVRVMGLAKRLHDGRAIYSDLRQHGLRVTAECLTALVVLFAQNGLIDRAIELIPRLSSLRAVDQKKPNRPDWPLSRADLQLLIRACARDETKLKALGTACIKHAVIDPRRYVLFLDEYKEMQNPKATFSFIEELRSTGSTSDVSKFLVPLLTCTS